ncbi:NAD-dependent epimerase/dehydratase family protein [Simiduia sp. 21SJ11W-1]|nr:NAD-dependent epimerase/dehydratase family protein [Simiduia sp. 21SJ11W-1]UTA49646.1 NAD-dependent epimerase/dehydratase family protein [Simiduia sp. 21SJ11W-1]
MQTLGTANVSALGLVRATIAPEGSPALKPVNYQDTNTLVQRLAGCHSLIHLVGKAHNRGGNHLGDYCAVNVDITLRVAAAAQQAGIKRFIFVSSVKAIGDATKPGEPFTNITKAKPADYYGKSKLMAEQRLQEFFKGTNTELLIVRPPLVWGEAPKGNLAAILKWAKTGIPLPLAGINNRRHWVSIERVCDFLAHLATREEPFNCPTPLLISDDQALSTPAAIEQMLRAQGLTCRLLPLPGTLWKLLLKLPGLGKPVAKLTGSLELDASHTWASTGFKPNRKKAAPRP